jgi:preprotein translocase subunit SecA
MSSAALGLVVPRGAYPERADPRPGWLDAIAAEAAGPLLRRVRGWRRWQRLVTAVGAHGQGLAGASAAALRSGLADLSPALRRTGFHDDVVARAFALVREVAGREIGQRHFDVQLVGGRVLLDGMIAEMETGEGKTLTATLAAGTAALAGIPVHVVTVNDYLARRDAEWMGPVYRALGLRVGVVVHGMDQAARRAAYACDVTYCTNKEVAFDYLRDRIVLGRDPSRIHLQIERLYRDDARTRRLVLRGLHYAIVDEADSVLVDEARTPLIISGTSDDAPARKIYETALALAGELAPDVDYRIDARERSIQLTDAGRSRLEARGRTVGGVWTGRQRREELVRQALSARHLFRRDQQYLVTEGTVQIIDEYTGRVMADRSWEHGLHQLIEAKEGCAVTGQRTSLARISYQRFFRRYLRLAGMTGTAREVAGELWAVYRLPVVRVPTNRPLARRRHADRVYATVADKWRAIVQRIDTLHRAGRPVLVGTRSVGASEHLSRLLDEAGLSHRVLNARQDQEEAQIVAEAGQSGRITVATNMAGRGTDIVLGPGVAALGGLHVIATERHDAGRIDRQLFGRAGRQGDAGSHEALLSLQDDLVTMFAGPSQRLARWLAGGRGVVAPWLGRRVVRRAQRRAERLHARMRRDLLKLDEQLETRLAFSGRLE